MRDLIFTGIIDRLLFTAIVIGILMSVLAGWRYIDDSNQLSANQAAQIHEDGGEVSVESKSQAHGLMASDLERRRLLADQSTMLMVGGAGLALIGLGWLAGDILRGRRRQRRGKGQGCTFQRASPFLTPVIAGSTSKNANSDNLCHNPYRVWGWCLSSRRRPRWPGQ